jgi:hypothetical protein
MSFQVDTWQMRSSWPVARSAEEFTCKYRWQLKINVLSYNVAELCGWVSDAQKFYVLPLDQSNVLKPEVAWWLNAAKCCRATSHVSWIQGE